MLGRTLLATVFAVLAGSETAASKVVAPSKPAEWSAAARSDVEDAYRILQANHPGMIDPDNPHFAKQLEEARKVGLKYSARTRNAGGYSYTLGAFQAVLRDGHAGPFDQLPPELAAPVFWPGFITVWRGDGLYVYASTVPAVPRGARITACDGIEITRLIRSNVFKFEGRPDEAGQWWVRARRVLLDLGNPFIRRPSACHLSMPGKSRNIALNWQPDTKQARDWRSESYNGDALNVGLTQPTAGIFWIALPTFDPDAEGIKRYERLFADLDRESAALRKARAIVVDLRQNQGGSSDWSIRVAQRLFGEARVDQLVTGYEHGVAVTWRATADNLQTLRAQVDELRSNGDLNGAKERATTVAGITDALAHNRPTFEEPKTIAGASPTADKASIATPIYVVVPGQCASACLDALDVFTHASRAKLIGAPSSGDSRYMDVRTAPLPSGLGETVIPMKVYSGRERASGGIYRPAIEMNELNWSTDGFLEKVQKDLGTRTRPVSSPPQG